jgi:hypothetical protein
MMSYMPFKRNVQLASVEGLINDAGLIDKTVDYNTRLQDQVEIKAFLEQVFGENTHLTLETYTDINLKISSEMFYGMMAILHEQLPCA